MNQPSFFGRKIASLAFCRSEDEIDVTEVPLIAGGSWDEEVLCSYCIAPKIRTCCMMYFTSTFRKG